MRPPTTANDPHAHLRILSMKEVCALTGYSRTQIYRLERAGKFPRRRKMSANKIGFIQSEVEAWIDNLSIPPLAAEAA